MPRQKDQQLVLIVEDEKSIVDIVRFNLEKEGYAVLTAYDGEAGLTAARRSPPSAPGWRPPGDPLHTPVFPPEAPAGPPRRDTGTGSPAAPRGLCAQIKDLSMEFPVDSWYTNKTYRERGGPVWI